jgi:hypothetical protein
MENCHSEQSEESEVCLQQSRFRFTREDSSKLGGERDQSTRRLVMFTGTLIDELISTVECAERRAHKTADAQETKTAYWYTPTERAPGFDPKFLGVA